MQATRPRYIVDEKGKKVAVVLEIAEYERLIEKLEELADIQAYDEAIAEGGEPRPFDEVVAEIERERGWRTTS
jgi:PHD/YefM family antitoxin component YafN of YafNO toxin-antitoxin module